jgi:hypothetical protein
MPNSDIAGSAAGPTFNSVLLTWGIPATVVGALIVLLNLKKIIENVKALLLLIWTPVRYLAPSLYTTATREEQASRRHIADLLLANLGRLESELHWQHKTFTDIHATLETPSASKARGKSIFGLRSAPTNLRTKSLSKALNQLQSGIINLQGAPGAGKSVAMRTYARELLSRAKRQRMRPSPLAIVVNMRDFNVDPDSATVQALHEYISSQLNSRGSPELDGYLSNKLRADIVNGDAVVLLDSFDEIPAVLGAAKIEKAIDPYVDTIISFMGGGQGKCVVASRKYRDPGVPGWTLLELLEMSPEEQFAFLKAYGVDDNQISVVRHLIDEPRFGFSADLRNPLYLSLLAQYVLAHNSAPGRLSEIFEDYVTRHLSDADPDSTEEDVAILSRALAALAVDLTKRPNTGLTAESTLLRQHIMKSFLETCQAGVNEPGSDEDLDKLLSIAVASEILTEIPAIKNERARYAFVHRRILEYFATTYVMDHSDEVSPRELATNGRWRETAVTMLQVASEQGTGPLEECIDAELRIQLDAVSAAHAEEKDFEWTGQATHLLELLVAAYGAGSQNLSDRLRDTVTQLVTHGWSLGGIADRKFALDCVPLISADHQEALVEGAFAGASTWLRMAALRDCSSMHPLPEKIEQTIRRLLITLMRGGQIHAEAGILDSALRRIYRGDVLVRSRRLLAIIPYVVFILCFAKVMIDVAFYHSFSDPTTWRSEILFWIFFPLSLFWLFQSTVPMSYPFESRMSRFYRRAFSSMGWSTSWSTGALWIFLGYIATVSILFNIGFAVAYAVTHDYWNAALELTVRPLITFYVILWGASALVCVRFAYFEDNFDPMGESVGRIIFAPFYAVPDLIFNLRRNMRIFLLNLLKTLLLQASIAAAIFGIIFLLDHYAGKIGRRAAVILPIALLALLPTILIIIGLREATSRWRVKRTVAASDSFTPIYFLNTLCGFADAVEAAEYLHAIRLYRSREVRSLPREFVGKLIRMIENAPDSGEINPVGNEVLDNAVAQSLITLTLLHLWRLEVLDELGELHQFLRER